ncbi:subtilisin-like protease SBT1.3 [Chenopodium quinoa]|uniref:subtilisin-like protease SBT1.3 n=1 Tax=Chenopodium quinoa TaxID=63459 RepID=UPI000B770024|nr:subtilisin-like protease SBT1.3 [Chenopodium quinoa]
MFKESKFLVVCFLLFLLCFNFVASTTKKTYIIQMDNSAMPLVFTNHFDWYSSKIGSIVADNDVEDSRVIYNYQHAFHGLAAQLTEEEASRLGRDHGVVALFPETMYQLHTTRSPMFLGLDREEVVIDKARAQGNYDVVVGVLDTGIWPESPSFNDSGYGPIPARWKGACERGRAFDPARHCNKKIVGARVFYKGYESATGKINEEMEYKSPRDQDGHGSHTAGTVAGSPVLGASLLGYAQGTARGMYPWARIAAYKVCWTGGCFSSDILSAVDQAVSDGVDVLSISLGGGVSSYFRDSLSVATFGAMEKGVFVSCSAGNAGPEPVSLTNVAPWVATVGASTLDRNFPSNVRLGSGKSFSGVSIYKGRMHLSPKKLYPVVYLGSNSTSPDPNSLCLEGTLDRRKVQGKIVICDRGISPRVQKGQVVKQAGGIGMILANTAANGEELVADCHLLPAVAVGEKEGNIIKRYASRANATATISFLGTKVGIRPSPVVAAFSSRGPNILSLEVLKPDVVAPGVNILAAWTGSTGPSGVSADTRRVKFNVLSGTSMSCPHVSGVAALIKARHPTWSPAAIKSALMTTAYIHDNSKRPLIDAATETPSSPFDHGAGHINPVRALNPGLVYDITPQEYFEFLCARNPTPTQLKIFSRGGKLACHNKLSKAAGDLNYPALSVVFSSNASISSITIQRTVTNVGQPVSSYRARVTPFKGAKVVVEPKVLHFTKLYQKLSYKVTFKTVSRQPAPEAGYLMWKDATHKVRSPVALMWLPPSN